MSDQKRAPRSVADPDRAAYERSIQENRRLQADRERREAAGRLVDTADFGAETAERLAKAPDARRLTKRVARLSEPAGAVIAVEDARDQYRSDRASGMPADEALVKGVGGYLGGELGGKAGVRAGAVVTGAVAGAIHPGMAVPGAVAGGVAGGLYGQTKGEELGQGVVEPYRNAKAWAKGVTRPLYDPIFLYDSLTRRR